MAEGKIEVSKIEEIEETKIEEIKETKIEEIKETKKEVKIESFSGEASSKETKDIEIETTENKKTSTVVESEEDSDEDIPDLEEENNVSSGITQADNAKIQSRGEKKKLVRPCRS